MAASGMSPHRNAGQSATSRKKQATAFLISVALCTGMFRPLSPSHTPTARVGVAARLLSDPTRLNGESGNPPKGTGGLVGRNG